MTTNITLSRTYEAPIEQVWEAISTKEAMSKWLMPCDFEPIVGHKFTFKTKPQGGFDGIVHSEVQAVNPPHEIKYSWSAGGLKNTIVSFKLESQGQQTLLYFEHSGFKGLANRLFIRNVLAQGWKRKILTKLLPQYLKA